MSYQELPVQMHLRYAEFVESIRDITLRKTPAILEFGFHVWLKTTQQNEGEQLSALKRDLNIKHREVAELQKQLAIMSEEYERVTEKLETRKEFDFLDARIDALDSVFKLASLVQFKYVQDVTEPNESNFKVSMAGGHYTFGEPEQYNEFMDKYLAWLESR
jgi:Tfp pilus assembly protein PilO